MNAKSKLAIILMFLTSIWFGLQSWLTQSAIHSSSALAFNTERYTIAALVMGVICLITRVKFTKLDMIGGAASGIAFAIMIGLESQSLELGSAGRVTFLGSLFVAIMPVAAWLVRSEKLFPAALAGSAIMLVGAWNLLFVQDSNNLGDVYGVLRAAACSVMLLVVAHFAAADWRTLCFINMTTVAVISLIGTFITGQTQFSVEVNVLAPVIASALIGSVLCLAVVTWSARTLSGSLMGILFFLDAPFSVIWGILLFKEPLSLSGLSAYLLIVIGAILAITAGTYKVPQFSIRFIEFLKLRHRTSNVTGSTAVHVTTQEIDIGHVFS
jgi:drug/metabolite transporter (DMT)-like permease